MKENKQKIPTPPYESFPWERWSSQYKDVNKFYGYGQRQKGKMKLLNKVLAVIAVVAFFIFMLITGVEVVKLFI